MKVFVTGATGYIGSNLLRAIVGAGHQVTALIRAQSREDAQRRLSGIVDDPFVDAVHGDLMLPNLGLTRNGLAGFDCVVHAAAEAKLGNRSPKRMERMHIHATRELAILARDASVPRFIHISTAYVVPPSEGVLFEKAPGTGAGNNAYETTKTATEHTLRVSFDPSLDIIRPAIVLPAAPQLDTDALRSPIGHFVLSGAAQSCNPASNTRPGFVLMNDLVDLILRRITSNELGCSYFNCVTKPFTMAELSNWSRNLLQSPHAQSCSGAPWRPYLEHERHWETSLSFSPIESSYFKTLFRALDTQRNRRAA